MARRKGFTGDSGPEVAMFLFFIFMGGVVFTLFIVNALQGTL